MTLPPKRWSTRSGGYRNEELELKRATFARGPKELISAGGRSWQVLTAWRTAEEDTTTSCDVILTSDGSTPLTAFEQRQLHKKPAETTWGALPEGSKGFPKDVCAHSTKKNLTEEYERNRRLRQRNKSQQKTKAGKIDRFNRRVEVST